MSSKNSLLLIFTIIIAPLLLLCNKKEADGNTDSGHISMHLQTNEEEKAEEEFLNVNKDIISSEEQYFIHSWDFEHYNGQEMEILKLDTNPYTAIEMIGWSNKGLFAYRTKHIHDSGMWGGWIYSLVIIDTVTDEIIEKNSFILCDDNETANNLGVISLPEENHNEISDEYIDKWNIVLKRYNINGQINNSVASDFKDDLLDFPINNFNCWFDYNISNEQRENNEFDIVNWKLIVGNDAIKKSITEKKDEQMKNISYISGRKILGYYKSPYENRIAVVVSYYHYIPFSGGYHTVGLDLFGCNMSIGLTQ